MGHILQGIIVSRSQLPKLRKVLPGLHAIRMLDELSLIPVNDELADEIYSIGTNLPEEIKLPDGGDGWLWLDSRFFKFLTWASSESRVMYLETEYHGGAGGQGSIVLDCGKVVFGPSFAHSGVINSGLRLMGVSSSKNADEFETFGLARHRNTEDWLEELSE